jgi:membrane-bound serine protease (ClpP class)
MLRVFVFLLFLSLAVAGIPPATTEAPVEPPAKNTARVFVIPVREEIATPALYVVRRGLKEAIEAKADTVVLDMKTPGGRTDVMFEIMEALQKFPGKTVTFVNAEAMSAGALIAAATDEIWFAPNGVIGAAAPVMSTGGEISPTMKQKVLSYFKAKVRASTEGKAHRADVVAAMMDEDFVLKIGGKLIKGKGSLLSLTATEACALYGRGADKSPLLGAGVEKDIGGLLARLHGAGGFEMTRLETTWAEVAAQYLNAWSPVLMALGVLALIIEFKTPGFGVFGITGGVLLAVVFLGQYVAGLSGHEPFLFFALGLALVLLELFFFPGVVFVALAGVVTMLGSLVWAMADLWPNQPVVFDGATFLGPVMNVGLGLLLAVALVIALWRFLPRSWIWGRMVLEAAVDATAQTAAEGAVVVTGGGGLSGRRGVAMTDLMPSGQVSVDGRRYEASVDVGFIAEGEAVRVTRQGDFRLVVEKYDKGAGGGADADVDANADANNDTDNVADANADNVANNDADADAGKGGAA